DEGSHPVLGRVYARMGRKSMPWRRAHRAALRTGPVQERIHGPACLTSTAGGSRTTGAARRRWLARARRRIGAGLRRCRLGSRRRAGRGSAGGGRRGGGGGVRRKNKTG